MDSIEKYIRILEDMIANKYLIFMRGRGEILSTLIFTKNIITDILNFFKPIAITILLAIFTIMAWGVPALTMALIFLYFGFKGIIITILLVYSIVIIKVWNINIFHSINKYLIKTWQKSNLIL